MSPILGKLSTSQKVCPTFIRSSTLESVSCREQQARDWGKALRAWGGEKIDKRIQEETQAIPHLEGKGAGELAKFVYGK